MAGFLDTLPPEVRRKLDERLIYQDFESGEEIISYQHLERSLYFLVNGTARVKIFSPNGRAVEYRVLDAGDMFGEVALIDGGPRSAGVVADTRCRVATLSEQAFWQITAEEPHFTQLLLRHLTRMIRALTERVLEFSSFPMATRLARELLRLADRAGVEDNKARIASPPTHQDLSDRISSHREAVSREMSALGRAGIVRRSTGMLTIEDIEALRRKAYDEAG